MYVKLLLIEDAPAEENNSAQEENESQENTEDANKSEENAEDENKTEENANESQEAASTEDEAQSNEAAEEELTLVCRSSSIHGSMKNIIFFLFSRQEFEIPKNLRSRDHIGALLGLDAESSIKGLNFIIFYTI